MKRILPLLLLAFSAHAAGLNDGSSWADAWTNLASVTWTRGDTYYIAGGTYTEDVTISAAESGTNWITLKKANAADNSLDAGWDSSFAADQAVLWGRLYCTVGYIEVNGVTGEGTSGHGIKIYRTDIDTHPNATVAFTHTTGSPFHLYYLEIGGPGYVYDSTGGDGVYWNSTSLASKGVHLNRIWLHEIPRNGVTTGHLVGTSYSDYGMLVENSVFERTGGVSQYHMDVHGQTFQTGYLNVVNYLIWRNNVFRNCTGQSFISMLGTSTNNYFRIYNNVFYNEPQDATIFGMATSGSTTTINQGISPTETQARSFSDLESETVIGRTLTNVTQGATGIITSISGTNITMSGGMSGGITNAEFDIFKFPCNGRSAYLLATSIYTTAGNTVNYFEILNNTFYNLHKANVSLTATVTGNVDNIAQNNLFMSNYFTTMAYCPTITSHGYWANADGTYDPANTETADPFVNSSGGDFHLVSTANAVGGGLDLSAIFTTDFDGTTRTVPFDIGAFEFPSIIGWWKFDDGSGVTATDSSGNGNDGTLTSGPTWVTGRIGPYAVSMDGVDDVVTVPYDAMWNFDGDFTVTAWVYSTQDARKSAVGRWVANLWNGWTLEQITSTRFDFEYQDRTITGEGSHRSIGSGLGYTTDAWHHVAGVKSGDYVYVYVNGSVGTTSTQITNSIALTTEGIAIGARKTSTPDAFWEGNIDDVRIYNRALSVVEIEALYNEEGPANQRGRLSGKGTFRGKGRM